MTDVVTKIWGFCHTLRHDGIDYGDYIEQITYLLFLKMADEKDLKLPEHTDWAFLRKQSGTELLDNYQDALRLLGKEPGILGDIFGGSQSRFTNPVNLKKLLELIDETEWTSLDVDVKGAVFEGLLEKAAAEGKKGAGQYFTPRLLIESMVRCIKPDPRTTGDFKIGDPACGTGGFLVAAYEWLLQESGGAIEREDAKRLRTRTYYGQDLVARPRRLALMNLYLHQVKPHVRLGDSIYEATGSTRFDVILTNPPFGTRGANQAPDRDDFVIQTSNKQLNFIQHVMTTLKPGGRAAVVVPDNCLFDDQASDVFRLLTEDCNLHTVLRLPNGTFSPYSPGAKTNVVFFQKGLPTSGVWIYDGRSNVPSITKKERPLAPDHFAEFEACYGGDPNGRAKRDETDSTDGRWRYFGIDEIRRIDFKIDSLRWLRDESLLADPAAPDELADDLGEALAEIAENVGVLAENLRVGSTSASMARGGERDEVSDSGEEHLPEGWTATDLGEVCLPPQYGWTTSAVKAGNGLKLLRTTDISSGLIDWDNVPICKVDPPDPTKYTLQRGDIVVSRAGSVGISYRLDECPPAVFASYLIRIRPRAPISPEFIELFMKSPQYWLGIADYSVGIALPNVNASKLRRLKIPIPPLSEQERLVAQLRTVLGQVEAMKRKLQGAAALEGSSIDTAALERAVLAAGFRGQLVVSEAQLAREAGREYETGAQLVARLGLAASSRPGRKP